MAKRSTSIFLAFLNLVAFLATVVVNALSAILPINGKDPGEISDLYPNLFVPSGLTFSIWGVIYILLGLFVIYGLVSAYRKNSEQEGFIGKIGILFFLSSAFNIGWIFFWHYGFVWVSLIMMVALFISLLSIYLRLGIGKAQARAAEKGMVHIAFSVYIGWITIATIANTTAFLVDIGWNGFGLSEQFWAVLVIAVGVIIGLAMLFSRSDIYYSLVVAWAILGILLKRLADVSTEAGAVIITTIVGLAIIVIGIITQLTRRKILY
jgi:hypothetical protein